MRVLYVIFVLCVGALVSVAVAAARHIRRHEVQTARTDPEPQIADEAPPEMLLTAQYSKDE